jgi:hypothetical protein
MAGGFVITAIAIGRKMGFAIHAAGGRKPMESQIAVKILVPSTKTEQLEVMIWQAGNGPKTNAVLRFSSVRKVTYTAGVLTIDQGSLLQAARN